MPDLLADAQAIFHAAVRRVQADNLLAATDPDGWGPRSVEDYDRIAVVGMGKAAMAMAGGIETQVKAHAPAGHVIVPSGYPDTLPDCLPAPTQIEVGEGGHPEPTAKSVRAGRQLLQIAEGAGANDLVLVLVSGGGTALATVPAGSLSVEAVAHTSRRLLRSGVPIQEVNVVRKHLTAVGGGQLAQVARPADVAGLVVSDVVGNDLSSIASGPTVPDPSTYADAVRILYRRDLWGGVDAEIREHLAAGANGRRPETPSEDADFDGVRTHLIGSNRTALQAARAKAEELGYAVQRVEGEIEGEAREVGRAQARRLRDASAETPTVWLWGGETTVHVQGDGKGGRNQEVALGAAQVFGEVDPGRSLVLLSGGTDGVDGPTDAAGAWATPSTVRRGQEAGMEAGDHLRRNDAYPFFEAVGHLLRTGPTHTNVMDVQVGIG